MCEDHGYERKYAIKLVTGSLPKFNGPSRPGPVPQYEVIEPVVRQIWLAAELPCGKRLVPILRRWLPFSHAWHRDGALGFDFETESAESSLREGLPEVFSQTEAMLGGVALTAFPKLPRF